MEKRKARSVFRPLTRAEKKRLQTYRKQIAEELPDLIHRNQMSHEAAKEDTLSGAIRRNIQRGPLTIPELAKEIAIDSIHLDEFLTGERTLRSDVMDRLVKILGLTIQESKSTQKRKLVSR